MARLFRPTSRQIPWLLVVGFGAVGYALYLRYLAIEQSSVALACDGGLRTWLCTTRKVVTALFTHSAFGTVATVAAVTNLVCPSVALVVLTLVAAGFGIVLYNVALSGLAVSLLILSLARPARAAD